MRKKFQVSTFMSKYIYPGAQSPLLLHDYLREVAHSPFELISLDDDRHNYYLTCKRWALKLDSKRDEIVARFGEPLYRRFRLFLWGSAAGFDTGLVQAYRWVLRLPDTRLGRAGRREPDHSLEHTMKVWGSIILGVLLFLAGIVWTLQGLDVLGESGGMNGHRDLGGDRADRGDRRRGPGGCGPARPAHAAADCLDDGAA